MFQLKVFFKCKSFFGTNIFDTNIFGSKFCIIFSMLQAKYNNKINEIFIGFGSIEINLVDIYCLLINSTCYHFLKKILIFSMVLFNVILIMISDEFIDYCNSTKKKETTGVFATPHVWNRLIYISFLIFHHRKIHAHVSCFFQSIT